ncbi:hypothetical protein IJ541_08960 [bacterium]|nr:hypothetical protein [bacterium]MBQ9246010.1 hypothetical protein [bacterium]MBQ9246887.1 hypothetical protein [bacterium]
MRTEAVQGNNQRHSVFFPMAKGAIVGAAAGYALKYATPLTKEEKLTDEYIKFSSDVKSQKSQFTKHTEKMVGFLKAKLEKSFAESEFIRLFEGLKHGDQVDKNAIRTATAEIEKSHPKELFEFKRLCAKAAGHAQVAAERNMKAYNLVTKMIRPTGFFLTAGAIVGAFFAGLDDILKTEIKDV